MRMLCWFGGAAAVIVWAVVYLGADHACRHPDSWAGRFFHSAYAAATTYNPVAVISRAAAGQAAQLIHQGAVPAPPIAANCPAAAVCDEHAGPNQAGEIDPQPVENINLARSQAQAAQAQQGVEPWPQAEGNVPAVFAEGAPPNAVEPLETMPPCVDDQEEVPATMPHADDAEETQKRDDQGWLMDFWRKLFGWIPEPKWAIPPELKWAIPAVPRPTGGQEESELVPGGKAPSLREAPAIHQQYPGCPFMDRCPGTRPRIVPDGPLADPPFPMPLNPMEKRKAKSPKATDAKKIEQHLDNDDSEESELNPKHPDVDTTEFRRSDARPGEFDPKPF